MYKHTRENRGEAQRKKKRKFLNRNKFSFSTLCNLTRKKNPILNQFSKVTKHGWTLLTFKWYAGSCASTKCFWKLCSLVFHLPVESFRTKGLPALHMQHAPKERTWTIRLTTSLLAYFGSKRVLLWSAFTNSTPAD